MTPPSCRISCRCFWNTLMLPGAEASELLAAARRISSRRWPSGCASASRHYASRLRGPVEIAAAKPTREDFSALLADEPDPEQRPQSPRRGLGRGGGHASAPVPPCRLRHRRPERQGARGAASRSGPARPQPRAPSSPIHLPSAAEEPPWTTLNHVLFGWYPYFCLTVFLLGSLVRFDREQYTWNSQLEPTAAPAAARLGLQPFPCRHPGIFVGHFVGLLTPIWVFDFLGIGHGFKQGMAIVLGGVAGVALLHRPHLAVHRRIFDARIRKTSSFADIAHRTAGGEPAA